MDDGLTIGEQATRRLAGLIDRRPQQRDVIEFHTRHKMLLLAHSPEGYATLGRMVATGDASAAWLADYQQVFVAALAEAPTIGGDVNALQHLAGHLRGVVTEPEQQDLAVAILAYQQGTAGRSTPVDLLRHHAVAHHVKYLTDQYYLFP